MIGFPRRKAASDSTPLGAIAYMPGGGFDLILSSLFINILALAMPLVLLQVYDRIIPNTAEGTLVLLVAGVATALFLEGCLRMGRSYVSGWMGFALRTHGRVRGDGAHAVGQHRRFRTRRRRRSPGAHQRPGGSEGFLRRTSHPGGLRPAVRLRFSGRHGVSGGLAGVRSRRADHRLRHHRLVGRAGAEKIAGSAHAGGRPALQLHHRGFGRHSHRQGPGDGRADAAPLRASPGNLRRRRLQGRTLQRQRTVDRRRFFRRSPCSRSSALAQRWSSTAC
jgi:hypothetical protein